MYEGGKYESNGGLFNKDRKHKEGCRSSILKVMPAETSIYSVENAPSPEEYAFIALGYWVDRGGPDASVKEYMTKIAGKKVCLFGTLGAYPDSDYAQKAMTNARVAIETKNEVVGEFICQGKIDPRLIDKFKSLPPEHPHAMTPERIKRHQEAAKHPNEEDFVAAQTYFRQVVARLYD